MSFEWPGEVVLNVTPEALSALRDQAPPPEAKHNALLMKRFIDRLDHARPEALDSWTLGRHEHRYLTRLASEARPGAPRRHKVVRLCALHVAALRPDLQATCLAHLIDEDALRTATAMALAQGAPAEGPRWFQAHARSLVTSPEPIAHLTQLARATGLGPHALLDTWELDGASPLAERTITAMLDADDNADLLTTHRSDLLLLAQNQHINRALRLRVLLDIFDAMPKFTGSWSADTSTWLHAMIRFMGGQPSSAEHDWTGLPTKVRMLGQRYERDYTIHQFFNRNDRNPERRKYWLGKARLIREVRTFDAPVDACAMRLGTKYYVEFRQRDRIDGGYDGSAATCYVYTPEEWSDLLSRPIKRQRDLQRRGLWGFPHRDRIARRSNRWQPLFDMHVERTLNR